MVARTVFSYVLNYYNEDYKGIGTASPSAHISPQPGEDNRQLYNGNISSMGVNIPRLGNSILYSYQYDQLNRLLGMQAWLAADANWNGLVRSEEYKEQLSYDPNGNIKTYLRNGSNSQLNLNNFVYNYTNGTNRLAHYQPGK